LLEVEGLSSLMIIQSLVIYHPWILQGPILSGRVEARVGWLGAAASRSCVRG
jgi:hypothetical protein